MHSFVAIPFQQRRHGRPLILRFVRYLTYAALRSEAARAAMGGGGYYPPPYLTREPAVVVRWARKQSKDPSEYFLRNDFLKVTSQVKVRSKLKIVTFLALSATETGLITVTNPNFAQRLPNR